MDRRHRPLLSWLAVGGALLGSSAAHLSAQPSATPAPAVSATPWVQASPPPGLTTPTPAPVSISPKPPKPPKPAPALSVTPAPEDLTQTMIRRRQQEEQSDQKPDPKANKGPARLEQLPPDERAAYQRNLPLWKQLPEEERDALRKRADERARQEIDHAYQETGLNLDHDQREVFDLRYKQERRRLEHDLQEKANAERQRRLVEITARLKQEFAAKPTPGASATPAPKKATPASTPAASPDASAGPGIGFVR